MEGRESYADVNGKAKRVKYSEREKEKEKEGEREREGGRPLSWSSVSHHSCIERDKAPASS